MHKRNTMRSNGTHRTYFSTPTPSTWNRIAILGQDYFSTYSWGGTKQTFLYVWIKYDVGRYTNSVLYALDFRRSENLARKCVHMKTRHRSGMITICFHWVAYKSTKRCFIVNSSGENEKSDPESVVQVQRVSLRVTTLFFFLLPTIIIIYIFTRTKIISIRIRRLSCEHIFIVCTRWRVTRTLFSQDQSRVRSSGV